MNLESGLTTGIHAEMARTTGRASPARSLRSSMAPIAKPIGSAMIMNGLSAYIALCQLGLVVAAGTVPKITRYCGAWF